MKASSSPSLWLDALLVVASAMASSASTMPPAPTVSGTVANCDKWAVVESGDTCATLESKYGITKEQFLSWNPEVSSNCETNFWGGYAYCVGASASQPTSTSTKPQRSPSQVATAPGPTLSGTVPNCDSWFLVKSGDTCATIEKECGITQQQFLAWNPEVNSDCSQDFWADYAYCVGTSSVASSHRTTSHATKTSAESSTPMTTSATSTNSFNSSYSVRYPITNFTLGTPTMPSCCPPKKTQSGIPSYCNQWHLVGFGETCNSIINQYAGPWMSADDFYAWNPAIGTNCGGLYEYYYVCVGIQPQTSMTIVWPTTNATVPPIVTGTSTFLPPSNSSFTPVPTQGALPTNCVGYYQAQTNDTCDTVVDEYEGLVTEEQFFKWNPVLDDNCAGMWAGYYYCILTQSKGQTIGVPTVATLSSAAPTQPGLVYGCKGYYQATPGDTCSSIVEMMGTFSRADFIQWNPALNSDCSGLTDFDYYCIAVSDTPATRTAPPQTPTKAALFPTQTGISSNCTSYWMVSSGETCDSIIADNSILMKQFLSWNPALSTGSGDCGNLVINDYVCVGLNGVGAGGVESVWGYNNTTPTATIVITDSGTVVTSTETGTFIASSGTAIS